jgi:hypothetical protein
MIINQYILLIMGFLKKEKTKKILKSVGNGILDSIPVVSTIKSNYESEEPSRYKIDYVRLATSICIIAGTAAVIFGYIDIETLKELLKLLN